MEAGDWELALKQVDVALTLATEEAFKADYPNLELSEERIQRAAERRKAGSLTVKGWTLANLGRVDEGMAAFEEAETVTRFNYIGATENDLNRYWARTYHHEGRSDKALELLIPEAVYGGDEEARALLEEIFLVDGGEAEDFERYLESLRQEHARTVDDFALPTYEGKEINLADLRRDKVVMLVFWFPT